MAVPPDSPGATPAGPLQKAIYGIRSARTLIEQLNFNLLLRWFVGLHPDDQVRRLATFSKNGDRLLIERLMARFLELLMASPEIKPLLSYKHFWCMAPRCRPEAPAAS